MHIANPIYDVVFKYLMEDSKIAKLILSTIMEEEVLNLEFKPQEYTTLLEQPPLTVYRLDFSATIKTPEGSKNVLIEIQKAKYSSDIVRFRRYLGEHYKNRENFQYEEVIQKNQKNKKIVKTGIPIVTIYFLGHELDYVKKPIIKVGRNYIDVTTKRVIKTKKKENFIESLSHDSFIIQIPLLRKKYQTDVERLLSIFDQKNKDADEHILNINEADYPQKYRTLIRRLQKAVSKPEIRDKMDLEDDIVEELQERDRVIEEQRESLEEKDKSLEEKDKDLEKQKKSIEEKDKSIEEKDKLIDELKKQIEKNKK